MFPIFWGGTGIGTGEPFNAAAPFALLGGRNYLDEHLPEEVREAIENSKDSIETEEDIHDIARESWLRR